MVAETSKFQNLFFLIERRKTKITISETHTTFLPEANLMNCEYWVVSGEKEVAWSQGY